MSHDALLLFVGAILSPAFLLVVLYGAIKSRKRP
jgi:hypothetical protein